MLLQDVLEEHQQHNRGGQPPNPQRLAQFDWDRDVDNDEDDEAGDRGHREEDVMDKQDMDDVDDDQEEADSPPRKCRAARGTHKKKTDQPSPKKLGFYPPSITKLITRSRDRMYLHLTLNQPFMDHQEGNLLGVRFAGEEHEKMRKADQYLEEGKHIFVSTIPTRSLSQPL